MGLKYLFTGSRSKSVSQKLFIALTEEVGPGQSYHFSTPTGEKFLLSNTGKGAHDYVAFSSICPHLGCKVHWEADKNRFFCPCHGGAFDITGKAVMGPPQKAGQSLSSCEVVVEGNAIYGIITI
ncbi:MAG: Rieske (2Fe-2S) protein [Spirochaetia bacterium]|nr:Rieske (2Fe-2S) protein [Spirochaetia bacterium]